MKPEALFNGKFFPETCSPARVYPEAKRALIRRRETV
jgi:hypothetical protein